MTLREAGFDAFLLATGCWCRRRVAPRYRLVINAVMVYDMMILGLLSMMGWKQGFRAFWFILFYAVLALTLQDMIVGEDAGSWAPYGWFVGLIMWGVSAAPKPPRYKLVSEERPS